MDRGAIQTIVDGDFEVPAGADLNRLTAELLAHLGSTDSHLREGSLEILWHWTVAGKYGDEALRAMGQEAANLSRGLGESGTDSVYLRSFSALILGMIVEANDARERREAREKPPFLTRDQVREWFEAALAAFAGEADLRGFVDGGGWAHAVAHKADLFAAFARSRHLDGAHLERILTAVAEKLTQPTELVFQFDEDNRLVRAVFHVLLRNEVTAPFLHSWIARLARRPDGKDWDSVLELHACDLAGNRARVNVRGFLRSLYFALLWGLRVPASAAEADNPYHSYYQGPIKARDALLDDVEQALRATDPSMYPSEENV